MPQLFWLLLIFPFLTKASIDSEQNQNYKTIHCHAGSHGFWDLYYWHYGNASTISISLLLGKHSGLVNLFISNIFFYLFGESKYRRSIQLQSFIKTSNDSWESFNVIFNNTRRTQEEYEIFTEYKKFNYNQKMRRLSGEPHYGFLWIAFDVEDLNIFLVEHDILSNPRGSYIIVFLSPDLKNIQARLKRLFRILWKKYLILNVYIKLSCSELYHQVFRYNPFHFNGNTSWGELQNFTLTQDTRIDELKYRNNLKEMQGYPIKISMFPRTPTAITTLPKSLQGTSIYKMLKRSGGFGGIDGAILAYLSYYLNFTTVIVEPPTNMEYGYRLKNGTLVGSLGDVAYKNVAANFNSRFVQQYDTDQIEFTNPVGNDVLCLLVPKSEKIPQWLKVLKCFTFNAWCSIFALWICVSIYWYLICQVNLIVNEFKPDVTFYFLEVFSLFVSVPYRRQNFDYRRIFYITCLVFNIIFIGTFQGSLYNSYSTVTYFPDINTLEELDRSGLQIRITSKSLLNTFGSDTNPVMKRLKEKINQFSNYTTSSIALVAKQRDSAAFERKNDARLRIVSEFTRKTDGFELLHVMQECPWTYYVAYIVPLGSPYLPIFNWLENGFLETGLISKWTADTMDAIILEKRVHPTEDTDTLKPFTLKEMQAAFYFVTLGLVFSFSVFIGELAFYWLRRFFIRLFNEWNLKKSVKNLKNKTQYNYNVNKKVIYPKEFHVDKKKTIIN